MIVLLNIAAATPLILLALIAMLSLPALAESPDSIRFEVGIHEIYVLDLQDALAEIRKLAPVNPAIEQLSKRVAALHYLVSGTSQDDDGLRRLKQENREILDLQSAVGDLLDDLRDAQRQSTQQPADSQRQPQTQQPISPTPEFSQPAKPDSNWNRRPPSGPIYRPPTRTPPIYYPPRYYPRPRPWPSYVPYWQVPPKPGPPRPSGYWSWDSVQRRWVWRQSYRGTVR